MLHPAPHWRVKSPGTVEDMWIGELSARSGIPRRTIRFYEEEGLLSEPPRTPSGYRDYGPEALERLSLVRVAKGLGMTLDEIREVFGLAEAGRRPCSRVREIMRTRAAEIDRRIEELGRLRERLEAVVESDGDGEAVMCPLIEAPHVVEG